jgi:DNA uptake protein ComE-like DNA-binding protein
MRRSVLHVLAAFVMLTALPAKAQQTKDDEWTNLLPPGDGRDLVINSCGSCHNVKVVVVARKSPSDWTKTVSDMIQRGAPVFPEETAPLTNYLSKSFGTDVPKLQNVNTTTRSDLEKIPSLKPETITRILEARSKFGPFKNCREFRQALGWDEASFEKVMYFFKYSD